jgi:hypothetical protein
MIKPSKSLKLEDRTAKSILFLGLTWWLCGSLQLDTHKVIIFIN